MKWFKHDSNAYTDSKMKRVRQKYGMVGYGLYWYCVELIAGKVDKENITFELEEDAEIIAIDWNLDQLKVEDMMRYFVEIGLFENQNNTITCLKLAKRLDDTNAKNVEIKKIINKLSGVSETEGDPNDSDKLGDTPNDSESLLPEETRTEETRKDNKKTKAKKDIALEKLANSLDVDVDLLKRIKKHRTDLGKPANTDKKLSLVIRDFRKCIEANHFSTLDQCFEKLDGTPWLTLKPEYLENGKYNAKHSNAGRAGKSERDKGIDHTDTSWATELAEEIESGEFV